VVPQEQVGAVYCSGSKPGEEKPTHHVVLVCHCGGYHERRTKVIVMGKPDFGNTS